MLIGQNLLVIYEYNTHTSKSGTAVIAVHDAAIYIWHVYSVYFAPMIVEVC